MHQRYPQNFYTADFSKIKLSGSEAARQEVGCKSEKIPKVFLRMDCTTAMLRTFQKPYGNFFPKHSVPLYTDLTIGLENWELCLKL